MTWTGLEWAHLTQGALLLALVIAFWLVFDSGATYLTTRRRSVSGFQALLASVDFQNDVFRAFLIQIILATTFVDDRGAAVLMSAGALTVLATAVNRWRVRKAVRLKNGRSSS